MPAPRPVQFLRDEAFSFCPIAREGTKRRWSVDAVIAEAERDASRPDSLKHVPEDRRRAPILLSEKTPSDVAEEAARLAARSYERHGKKLRKSARVIVSRVMSYPRRCDDFGMSRDVLEAGIRAGLAGDDVSPLVSDLVGWMRAAAAWSTKDLGVEGAIVAHCDEECVHLHHLVPLRPRADDPRVADLSFWRPGAAMIAARDAAKAAGKTPGQREVQAAFGAAAREIADDFYVAVGAAYGHARITDQPRRRREYRTQRAMTEAERRGAVAAAEAKAKTESERAQRAERELKEQRARAERAEAESRSLSDRLAAADAEIGRLRDKLRQVLDRARTWFGALRGDPAAVRDATEPPTLTEAKVDSALGISRDHLQRRRVSAI